MQYYVSAGAARPGDGSRSRPFPTIQQAADIAGSDQSAPAEADNKDKEAEAK